MTSDAAVAAGNADTAQAAAQVLRAGGNAFDAAVAAGFAAAVAEPALSSLGGGGFLLAAPADAEPFVLDFFVDAPGRGRDPGREPSTMHPVTVAFAGADQVFHADWGSVAVPGCLDGYLHAHRRLGRLPLADVVEPAHRLAREGTVLDPTQAMWLRLLQRILTLDPEGRAVFAPGGTLLGAGDRMRNEALADLLEDVGSGRVPGFACAGLAGPLEQAATRGGGSVTNQDLQRYAVVERPPLTLDFRGMQVVTNPPPSFGGSLVLAGLAELAGLTGLTGGEPGSTAPATDPGSVLRLAEVLVGMSQRHVSGPTASLGTTHVSVVDGDGNLASMTTSNGSCSGRFVPGTGIQLNNVMGEADLHPDGFSRTRPGVRIGSMMAPSLVRRAGDVVGLGSGGSERIRSALACVLAALADRGMPLSHAVQAPRLHWDGATLQVEPGLEPDTVRALASSWPVKVWPAPDLFFGGVHAVARAADGRVDAVGDPRRCGATAVVHGG